MKALFRILLLTSLAVASLSAQNSLAVGTYTGYNGTFPVAPGSLATAYGIFGNIPVTSLQSYSPLPTTLANTQLTVDGAATPLYFVSSGQINFVVPFGLADGRHTARVVVGGVGGPRRAVLGPALDGGYWLLGLSDPCAAVFEGVPMSAATTGARQLRRLREGAYDVAIGETARDVDTIEDAFAVADLAPASRFARTLRRFALERRTDQLDDGRRA